MTPEHPGAVRGGLAPPAGCVRLAVRASGVNRLDILQASGAYPVPPGVTPVPGVEACGVVTARGEGAGRFSEGDRVAALVPGGGYAPVLVADERHCVPVPPAWTDAQGASLVEGLVTVYQSLFEGASVARGDVVLVRSAAGGVGSTAVSLCAAAGAVVIAVVGDAKREEFCRSRGAAWVAVRDAGPVERSVRTFSPDGVDVVFETVGGDALAESVALLRPGGRIALVGLLGGGAARIDLGRFLRANGRLTAATLRDKSADEKARLVAAAAARFPPAGWAAPPAVDSCFAASDHAEAHARMRSGGVAGKVVLIHG